MASVYSLDQGDVVQILPGGGMPTSDETKEAAVLDKGGGSALLTDGTILRDCHDDPSKIVATGHKLRIFSFNREAHEKLHAAGKYQDCEIGVLISKFISDGEVFTIVHESYKISVSVVSSSNPSVVFLNCEINEERLTLNQGDSLMIDGKIILTFRTSQWRNDWRDAGAIVHIYPSNG